MSEYMTPPLTEDKGGEYICMAINSITGKHSNASVLLTVIGPIKSVQIDTSQPHALENYSYNLTCRTVTFWPVDRYDAGLYQCMATNAVGNVTSKDYMLHVNFGPEEPTIYGPDFGETERDAVFICSATSVPPSTYTWWFNDSLVANTSEFRAGPLSLNMSGTYTCMAHNNVTRKNITNSTMLTVIEAIESVMIQSNTTPINYENITLTCHIVGPFDTIYWMKDNMQLNLNASETDSFMYNFEKNMMHFTPLTINSNGTYQCVATNRAAHHKSPHYALIVNYGPLNVNISGPESAKVGASVSLTCSAVSQPECNFTWFLNNQSTPVGKGSILKFNASESQTGKYHCTATNSVTNITMEQSKTFAIADHASASYIPNKGALLLMGLYSFFAHLLFL
ncbi:hypothetical protein AMECASPLE_018117 [Ameca splendens]|uniref:Ig-like domain-containing protein n=1 Tax=Ameca splendens TaxID=208324 RepID=A0ABV0Z2H5_9TELE